MGRLRILALGAGSLRARFLAALGMTDIEVPLGMNGLVVPIDRRDRGASPKGKDLALDCIQNQIRDPSGGNARRQDDRQCQVRDSSGFAVRNDRPRLSS